MRIQFAITAQKKIEASLISMVLTHIDTNNFVAMQNSWKGVHWQAFGANKIAGNEFRLHLLAVQELVDS